MIFPQCHVLVRAAGDPNTITPAIKSIVASIEYWALSNDYAAHCRVP